MLSEVCATYFMPRDHSSDVLEVLKIISLHLTRGSFRLNDVSSSVWPLIDQLFENMLIMRAIEKTA